MRVALLGLGLIGGSVALALRVARAERIVAWTPSGSGPRRAAAEGVIDAVAPTAVDAIEGADLVILAAPPLACLELLDGLAGPWSAALDADATVTDVASTKGRILARADTAGLPFVGGHPLAGRETSGFAASSADLFADRPWVVVPGAAARDADVERVEWLATTVGARPVRMTADGHDAAVAAISHLPLLASAALAEAVAAWSDDGGADGTDLSRLAASGWRGATRLARGDPTMGAGMLATNAEHVTAVLAALRDVLDSWAAELERPDGADPDRLRRRLEAVRARLLAMDEAAG